MEMHQVRYFLAVAEHLNFTRAAEKMNVAQPSLTRAILKLEDELGGPLFNRERNNTHLTELGRIMLPHLKAAADAAEQARAQAAGFQQRETGQLILAHETGINLAPLATILARLTQAIPRLEISLISASQNGVTQCLTEGKAECGLMELPAIPPERLDVLMLYEDPAVLAFQADHPFAARESLEADDLAGIDLVLGHAAAAGWLDKAGIRPARRHDARGSAESAVLLMAAGMGCALLYRSQAQAAQLDFRPIEPAFAPARSIVFATIAGRRHSPALQATLKEIRAADWQAAG